MTDRHATERTNRIRSAFASFVESVQEARRMQAEGRRRFPHLRE